jgi:uncharacterized membrane protein
MSLGYFWFLTILFVLFEACAVGMIVYWSLTEGWDTPEHVEIPNESPEELRKVIIGSIVFAIVGLIIIVVGS